MTNNLVKFGTKTFCITDAQWDGAAQEAHITFEDDNGIVGHVTAGGMSMQEQRQAVFGAVMRAR